MAQKTVNAPCWDMTLLAEGKSDTTAARVYGRLMDIWGNGVANKVVRIGPYIAVTDTYGHFRFSYIEPGTYEVFANDFCPLSGRRIKIRKKQKLRMNILLTVEKTEHPGLGIPVDGK